LEPRSAVAAIAGFMFVAAAVLLHYYAWVSALRGAVSRTVILYGGDGGFLVEPPSEPGLHYNVSCIPGGAASVSTVNGVKVYVCPPGTRSVLVEAWGPGPGWIRFSSILPVPSMR